MRNHTYRLPPCPYYDVGGTERWLETMAARGWLLERGGILFGIAGFERAQPARVRYRLEPAPVQAGMWDKYDGEPPQESLELCRELGWEYVDRRGQFYIYRCSDPEAPELNTEPETQALAVQRFYRRERSDLISNIVLLLLYALMFAWRTSVILSVIELGTGLVLFGLGLLLWMLVRKILMLRRVSRMKKRLAAGETLPRSLPRFRSTLRYHGARAAFFLLAAVFICLFVHGWLTGDPEIQIDSYTESLPFATMAELAPGEFDRREFINPDTLSVKSDLLAPTVIHYSEHGDMETADGRSIWGGMYVDYYRMASPFLARAAAGACVRRAEGEARELDCPGCTATLIVSRQAPFSTAVICRGEQLAVVMFYQGGEDRLEAEEWVGPVARSLN